MPSKKRQKIQGYKGVYFNEKILPPDGGTEKVYYIRYWKDGRQVEEKAGSQYRDNMTAAKAFHIRCLRMDGLDATNSEKKSSRHEAAEAVPFTFDDAWKIFEEVKASNRTIGDDRSRYSQHVAPAIGRLPLAAIATGDLDKLRLRLERAGKSPQTVRHVLVLVRRLLNFALQRGFVSDLPRNLFISMPHVDNTVTENLTPAQLRRLMRVLDEEDDQVKASIMRLALFTGMRRGAILNLKWDDLDFERGFILLRGAIAKKKRTETIPMNDAARAILLALPRGKGPYVFPGRYDDRPLANISAMLRRVRKKAGLPHDFRPLHGLRHSFASWLASSGKVSMFELQKLLTHSTPQMTQRYAHLHDEALRKASGVAGSIFGAFQHKK